ncbi:hypothetical protein C8J56DRAFT_1039063 [Mycena floridula]|nr:hypothetical protein C8J56DRAFT_1039063 [Mycena floridula]
MTATAIVTHNLRYAIALIISLLFTIVFLLHGSAFNSGYSDVSHHGPPDFEFHHGPPGAHHPPLPHHEMATDLQRFVGSSILLHSSLESILQAQMTESAGDIIMDRHLEKGDKHRPPPPGHFPHDKGSQGSEMLASSLTPGASLADSASLKAGTNTYYAEEMYGHWQQDPKSVHVSWDVYFSGLDEGLSSPQAFQPPLIGHLSVGLSMQMGSSKQIL